MTLPKVLCVAGSIGLLVTLVLPRAFAAPPDWLVNVTKIETPALPSDAPAVVLLDETVETVEADAAEIVRHRYAVRILNRSGQQYARGTVSFLEKDDHVATSNAWVVRAGKEVSPKEKPQWIDESDADYGQVFSEVRRRAVRYDDFALPGDVFACETIVRGNLNFPRLRTTWAAMLPTLKDSFTLQLPPNWKMEAMLVGPVASMVRTATGSQRWTWELNDRPYRPDEPAETESGRTDARLMITIYPTAEASGELLPALTTWRDVSAWLMAMQDGQCDTSPALVASVNQLIQGSSDSLGKIRALSRYVQNLRYVSYDKGLSKGYGVRPRKASEVYAKGWGDCKAKANLLRAMLRTASIDSYMVQAHASSGREINEGWPSPSQFNHAILAIKVDASVDVPAVLDIPNQGRFLFFDATNPDVLVGDLPSYLQGGKVQVVSPGSDALTTLPMLPAESCHLNSRHVLMDLASTGSVSGECSYGGPGSVGAHYRALIKRYSAKDLRKHITKIANDAVSGALIEDVAASDDLVSGDCHIKYRFSAPHFAQLMPGGLAVVRLDVLGRDTVPVFPSKDRKLPIDLKLTLQRDEVTLKLPAGFAVDELPDPAELKSPYGHYESSYTVVDGAVIARRTLRLEDRVVPVGEYAALRKFLGDVAKADHSSVVLRKSE